MSSIHPASVVDKQAELDDDTEIGPGCVIQGKVKIGPGTRLIGNVYLQGPLEIGSRNTFYPFCCIGFAPQAHQFDPKTDGAGVHIGNDNIFRESVTVHRATGLPPAPPSTIGNRNYFMVNSHAGHDVDVGDGCTLANGVLIAGHVTLQDTVVLGGNAVVHQYCRVGRLSILGGVQGIGQDLPPFCVCYVSRRVSSLNFVGLRRAGYRPHIEPLKQAFEILFRGGHTNRVAVEMIENQLGHDPLCLELAGFVSSSKRGIPPYASSEKATEAGVETTR